MKRSQVLFADFLGTYTPNVSAKVRKRKARADLFIRTAGVKQREAKRLQKQISKLKKEANKLEQEADRLVNEAHSISRSFSGETEAHLFPGLVFEDMRTFAHDAAKLLVTVGLRVPQDTIKLIDEVVNGTNHAHALRANWSILGDEVGDAIFIALLTEAGVLSKLKAAKKRAASG